MAAAENCLIAGAAAGQHVQFPQMNVHTSSVSIHILTSVIQQARFSRPRAKARREKKEENEKKKKSVSS